MTTDLSDVRERVTRNEQRLDTMTDVVKRTVDTQDRLVRFMTRHEETRDRLHDAEERADEAEERADEAAGAVDDLRAWVKSRWYVLVTVVGIITGAVQIAIEYLL